ncbi:MAG TPA: tRNA lysidine(34) synthetase TilS [Candidatus Hydrothermia bacterium]|nr:tRNA lysidine(34) synthetase TilS [Candidatus Hydrothermia bacterium]HOK23724.1 tRNA lysidine(34) synthetase TilS [Candidatus Hydrothermia bacterium]HOL24433.1 tRNA lysidine(34) synthetase TilS [Candidatus Hydrothermia bacterium]HOP32845.1 tRNA lysidine(34) synthetase TilS [Candidatus Hydrothermia bacterium]HPO79434.1 tRNA lysidine(34) synthetase TilS [Candidatus Hydrothermia bacterium]
MEPYLLEKFEKAVKKYKLISKGDKILVGFSGGPDSVFLTEMLQELQHYLGIQYACIHINHLLRGKEALRDENFCVDYCRERRIPLYIERVDVAKLRKLDESVEAVARRIRYEKFREYAGKYGFNKVALAHNASDSVETFLINLIRGTGVWGLRGIPPRRGIFIRPIIYISRQEVLAHLNDHHIPYVIDSTNLEPVFLRNAIRLKLIPLLEELRAGATSKIRETTEIMNALIEYLEDMIGNMEVSVLKETFQNAILIDFTRLRNYHYFIQMQFLQRQLMLTNQEYANLESLLNKNRAGYVAQFYVVPSSKELFISRGKIFLPEKKLFIEDFPQEFDGFNLRISITEEPQSAKYAFKLSRNMFPLLLRARRQGDKFGEKSLSSIFERNKIPGWRRDLYPIFEKDGEVLWVPGVASKTLEGDIYLEVSKIDEKKFWIFD